MIASIVTYHTPLDELIKILSVLSSSRIDEVWVVDNGREEAIRKLCEGWTKAKYYANENTGYGSAHNIAINESLRRQEEFHLVLNSDIICNSTDIDAILRYIKEHPDIVLLHPRMLNHEGKDQYTVRQLPTPADLILRRFLPKWLCRNSRKRYLLQDLDHKKTLDVPYVQGSFMLMRCSALQKTGIFDERFFMYPEDIDLSRRLAQVGRVVFWPGVSMIHTHRAGSYSSWRMTWLHVVNMCRYFNKWGWLCDSQRKSINRAIRKNNFSLCSKI